MMNCQVRGSSGGSRWDRHIQLATPWLQGVWPHKCKLNSHHHIAYNLHFMVIQVSFQKVDTFEEDMTQQAHNTHCICSNGARGTITVITWQ